MTGPDQKDADIWIPKLTVDHDNLRAALDRVTAAGDGVRAQQLAGALWKFWYMTGAVGEGNRRLSAALANDTPPTSHRVRALHGGTAMALETGDSTTGRRWAVEALEIARQLSDPIELAHSEFILANVEADEAHWPEARALLERSREAFRRLRPLGHYALLSTRILSWVCAEMGDHELARSLDEENLRDARAVGNARVEAMTIGSLAYRAIDAGRLGEAAPLLRDSYRMRRDQGDQVGVANDLYVAARLCLRVGRPTDAAMLMSGSRTLYAALGAAIPSYDRVDMDETDDQIRAALSSAELERATDRGRSITDEQVDVILEEVGAALSADA